MKIRSKNYRQLYDNLLFKLLERISRFYRHINETKHSNPDYYSEIIFDLESCIWAILATIIDVQSTISNKKDISAEDVKFLYGKYSDLKSLHEKLSYLPRPDKPVELHRFSRIFKEGLSLSSGKKHEFTIGVREVATQVIYRQTPISELRDSILKDNPKGEHFINELKKANNVSSPPHHITIPRIEVNNPLVWSTMAHEIAHSLIDQCIEPGTDFVESFNNYLESNHIKVISTFNPSHYKQRLLEYWCDFLGTIIMGHAFWFAQYESMLFGGFNHTGHASYPPDHLRLWLIRRILKQRLSPHKIDQIESTFDRTNQELLEMCEICGANATADADQQLVMQFFRYISQCYIFRTTSNNIDLQPQLKNLLSSFVENIELLNDTNLKMFIDALKRGVPIPSVRVSENRLQERPAKIHEMLLAGVSYRNSALKEAVLSSFSNLVQASTPVKQADIFINIVSKIFGEFDSCLLRSIQISEYVSLLAEEPEKEENIHLHSNKNNKNLGMKSPTKRHKMHRAMLTDSEIREKLQHHDLSIVPLISEKQIGSTSLDIRLGTSFQIYHPNRSGIVDFTSRQSLEEAERNSYMRDLNFLEYIVVAPSQFVLGHTMEYLDLPSDIAAELEGRSSYARLGIEIHMTAGFVDSGFSGVLTLEIFNAGPNPVKLFPGLRIGQLRFFQCSASDKPYRDPNSKYRGLLAHTGSLHFKDYEIDAYKQALTSQLGAL